MENDHLPKRPTWDCDTCGHPWPCAIAKTNLLDEYQGKYSALLQYLGLQLWEAVDDYAASGAIPPDLRERFMAWLGS